MQKDAAGGMAAAPIWNDFMKQALLKFPKEDFPSSPVLTSDKPMLDGNYIIQTENGFQVHNILYWIDKNNPLGPPPQNPQTDSQFASWEFGVKKWLQTYGIETGNINGQGNLTSKITLTEPKESDKIKAGESLKISFKTSLPITKAELYFNGKILVVFEGNEENLYSVFFLPTQVRDRNEILIKVFAENQEAFELAKEISGKQ